MSNKKLSYYQRHRDWVLIGLMCLALPSIFDISTNYIPLYIKIPMSIIGIFSMVYFFKDDNKEGSKQ
uniref:ORF23 n=1 Tax=Nitrosopumilaceae spindle-shaped virus TaxID=3065433 RepID=A0AAT9J9Z7_9VIRU